MLFDLQGRGRKSTIKVIYVTLAILMGGGLVLFGIGGAVNGGLLDAITENNGGGGDDSSFEKRVDQATAATRARPDDPKAWATLARSEFLLAGAGDRFNRETQSFNDDGVTELRKADRAWKRHIELAGRRPDSNVATLMVQAYSALNRPEDVVTAQEIITESRPSSGSYATLAQLAYAANQMRKGDLAKERALDETPRDQRPQLERTLDQAKQQAQQPQGGASPTPTPSAGG